MREEECNHADKNINKSRMKYKIKRWWWDSASEGNAWNITIYKLLPYFCRDPFVIGYHVSQRLKWWEGWQGEKRQGVPGICNTDLISDFLKFEAGESLSFHVLLCELMGSFGFLPCILNLVELLLKSWKEGSSEG